MMIRRAHPHRSDHRRRGVALLAALSSLALTPLAVPTAASAATAVAPPGNSGVAQYMEAIPTAAGGKSTGAVKVSSKQTAKSAGIPTTTYQQLEKSGQAGQATAQLVAATSVSSNVSNTKGSHATAGATGSGGSTSSGSGSASASGVASASPASQLLKTIGGSAGGGISSLLPVILGIALVGISAAGILLRRKH